MDTITLYQRDSLNKIRVWSTYGEEDPLKPGAARIVTVAGILGGELVTTKTPVLTGKNIGRSNETTALQQACFEAEAEAKQKLKKGYVENISDLKNKDELGSGIKAPMLSHKFHPTGAQSSSKTLKQMKLEKVKAAVQRKKDGNRCLIRLLPHHIPQFFSRNGTLFNYQFPIMATEIYKQYVAQGYEAREQEVVLDGELYTNKVSFNKLNGILKAKEEKFKPGYQELLDDLHYHLFDTFADFGYEMRHNIISDFVSEHVHIEQYEIIELTNENLLSKLREYVAEGEEGLMIRLLDKGYDHKRTWSLMKYKHDETAEYPIVGMEEHVQGGMVGAVILQAPAGTRDRDGKDILTFKAGTTALSHEESREMWEEFQADKRGNNSPTKYLGCCGVVRFFEYSEYNIPRFPKFIGVRADNPTA